MLQLVGLYVLHTLCEDDNTQSPLAPLMQNLRSSVKYCRELLLIEEGCAIPQFWITAWEQHCAIDCKLESHRAADLGIFRGNFLNKCEPLLQTLPQPGKTPPNTELFRTSFPFIFIPELLDVGHQDLQHKAPAILPSALHI